MGLRYADAADTTIWETRAKQDLPFLNNRRSGDYLATLLISPPCESCQCPRINSQERACEGVKAQTGGQQAVTPPNAGSDPDKPKSSEQGADRESTVPFFGWRIKASELLLIALAAALWLATRNLVLGADENAERQLRAYMGIDAGAATIVGNQLMLWVDVKNRGQTPAYRVTMRFDGGAFPNRNVVNFSLPANQRNWVIVPGAYGTPRRHIALAAARTAGNTVFFWGRVDYEDVFGEAHWMTFRYELGLPTMDPTTGAHARWELDPTAVGNDASR